jgi:hypothetical protein
MGVAALISWLVTAFFGLYLLAVWLIEYDVTGEGAPASRLPTPVILGHVLFALTGAVFWVIHLLSHASTQGWAAVRIPAVIAARGLTMFTRWIPVHRAFAAAGSGPGTSRPTLASRPNGSFPCLSLPATACSPSPPSPWCCSPWSKADWPQPRGGGGTRAGVVPATASAGGAKRPRAGPSA